MVFSDANTMLAPNALIRLVRHFQNPLVGCVCGESMLRPAANGNRSEGVYWRYEVFLKFLESRLNMLVGANGGLLPFDEVCFHPFRFTESLMTSWCRWECGKRDIAWCTIPKRSPPNRRP